MKYTVGDKKWQWWWSIVAYVMAITISLFCGYLVILYLTVFCWCCVFGHEISMTVVRYGTRFPNSILHGWLLSSTLSTLQDIFINQFVSALLSSMLGVSFGLSADFSTYLIR